MQFSRRCLYVSLANIIVISRDHRVISLTELHCINLNYSWCEDGQLKKKRIVPCEDETPNMPDVPTPPKPPFPPKIPVSVPQGQSTPSPTRTTPQVTTPGTNIVLMYALGLLHPGHSLYSFLCRSANRTKVCQHRLDKLDECQIPIFCGWW